MVCLSVVVASCSFPLGPDGRLRRTIRNQRGLWEASRPASYAVDMVRRCFCPYVGWVRVSVAGSAVVDVEPLEELPLPAEEWLLDMPSVDGLFDILVEAIDRGAARIDIRTWDPTWSYPADFYIDYSESVADEEIGYEARNLRPLS